MQVKHEDEKDEEVSAIGPDGRPLGSSDLPRVTDPTLTTTKCAHIKAISLACAGCWEQEHMEFVHMAMCQVIMSSDPKKMSCLKYLLGHRVPTRWPPGKQSLMIDAARQRDTTKYVKMLATLVWHAGDLYDLRSINLRSIVRREAHQIQCNEEATDEAWESLSDFDDSDGLSAC